MFNPLNNAKAAALNPFHDGCYDIPNYITPGSAVTIKIESREQELSILAAFDYGIDALNEEGRQQLDRLIADLKVAITGR